MVQIIPHRELRNNSSSVLRSVASGEAFEITNHGDVVAVLSPPNATLPLRMRSARVHGGFSAIASIRLDHPIQTIIDDLRGER